MDTVLGLALFGACLVMVGWPLFEYAKGRERFCRVDRYSRAVVVAYYLTLLCLIGTCQLPDAGIGILTSLEVVVCDSILALVVVGPLVGFHLRASIRGAASQRIHCPRCGYNLTGNVSGACPECSRPVDGPLPYVSAAGIRSGLPRWRKVVPVWLLSAVTILFVFGYSRCRSAFICSECARHEFRTEHRFRVPFGGPFLPVGHTVRTDPWGPDPLTPYLDPSGQCSHCWFRFGRSYGGLGGYPHGTVVRAIDPSRSMAAQEVDFARFVADSPNVLDRVRASLRKGERISVWIEEEYQSWEHAHEESREEP